MDIDTNITTQNINISTHVDSTQAELPQSFRTTTRIGRNKSLKDLKAGAVLSNRITFDPTDDSCPKELQQAATIPTTNKLTSDLQNEINLLDFKHRKRAVYSTSYGPSYDLSHLYDNETDGGFYGNDHSGSGYNNSSNNDNDDYGYFHNGRPRWQPYKPIEKCINFSCMDYNSLTHYCQMFNLYNYNELKDCDFNFNNNESNHVDSKPNYKKLTKTQLVEIVKNHILHTYSPADRDEKAIIGDFFTFIQRRREKIAKRLNISPVRSNKRKKHSTGTGGSGGGSGKKHKNKNKDKDKDKDKNKDKHKDKDRDTKKDKEKDRIKHQSSNSRHTITTTTHGKNKNDSSKHKDDTHRKNKNKNKSKSKNRSSKHNSGDNNNNQTNSGNKNSRNDRYGNSKNTGIIIDDSSSSDDDDDDISMNARYESSSTRRISRSQRNRSNDSESQKSSKHKKKHKSKHKKSKHKDKDKEKDKDKHSGHESKKSKKDKHKKKKHKDRDKGKTKDRDRKR